MRSDVRRIQQALRSPSRGVSLVEGMIVVATMAMISFGATYLRFSEYRQARVRRVLVSASVIKRATEAYVERDMPVGAEARPILDDLVEAKKIDGNRTDEP